MHTCIELNPLNICSFGLQADLVRHTCPNHCLMDMLYKCKRDAAHGLWYTKPLLWLPDTDSLRRR